jgi:hypothetical protein
MQPFPYDFICKAYSAPLDLIQTAAFIEGIYMVNPNSSVGFHIFSSKESRACLNNRTILMAGDTFMKNTYIGLSDILLHDPNAEVY